MGCKMNTYKREVIGDIVIIQNLIFENSRTKQKEPDHAWKLGRPCIIIYSDNEYDYFLPMKTNIVHKKYEFHHFTLDENNFICEQINNHNSKRRNKTKGAVNLQHVYKIPIAGHETINKVTFETYKEIINKLKECHQKQNLNELLTNARYAKGR